MSLWVMGTVAFVVDFSLLQVDVPDGRISPEFWRRRSAARHHFCRHEKQVFRRPGFLPNAATASTAATRARTLTAAATKRVSSLLGAPSSDDVDIEADAPDDKDFEDSYDDVEEEAPPPPKLPGDPTGGEEDVDLLMATDLERLTVQQLRQQLRLRGMKVSGRKSELVERLLPHQPRRRQPVRQQQRRQTLQQPTPRQAAATPSSSSDTGFAGTTTGGGGSGGSKARRFAAERGKEIVDVTPYLDEEDVGKEFKTAKAVDDNDDEGSGGGEDGDAGNDDDSGPEVWGGEARMVDDYEGRSVVVDGLSRTVIEFVGSNRSYVQAYVVASRDALKPFLAGGGFTNKGDKKVEGNGGDRDRNATAAAKATEERLREMQLRRERAARRPRSRDDEAGVDEGDETGLYEHVLDRDVSDWGKYTAAGAQLSASEVQGVLLLSDVYGPFTDDVRALAEKIAFECQPVVVMVPDMFRGKALHRPTEMDSGTASGSGANTTVNTAGMPPVEYERWRARHCLPLRVSVDVRAAAACLRHRYGASSIALWGLCYGGGRALEAAAGWLPADGGIHDIDGSVGPPPVNPMAIVAWYPARYCPAEDLFGENRRKEEHYESSFSNSNSNSTMAVMALFAGEDTIPGATAEDAARLKALLQEDERVKDFMVKVFPGQRHGFAHYGLGQKQQGQATQRDEYERFVDEEFGGAGRVSLGGEGGDAEVACLLSTAFMETYTRVFLPTVGPPIRADQEEAKWTEALEMDDRVASSKDRNVREEIEQALDGFVEEPLGGYRLDRGDESQEAELARLLRSMQEPDQRKGPYAIEPDDDIATMYAKLKASDDDFQLF